MASGGPSLPSGGEKPLRHRIHSLVDGLGCDFDGCSGQIDAADAAASRRDIRDGIGGVW